QTIADGAAAGLSQRQIAAAVGRSQPEVARILREIRSADRTWMTARDAAGAIRRELAAGDEDFALRMLIQAIDDFRHLDGPSDITEFLRRPEPTGDHRWDTLVAGAVARACRLRGLPAPKWTRRRPLATWWFPGNGGGILAARTMQRTPVDLERLGIYLDAAAFHTA